MSASSSDSWILIALTILVVLLLFYLSKKMICNSYGSTNGDSPTTTPSSSTSISFSDYGPSPTSTPETADDLAIDIADSFEYHQYWMGNRGGGGGDGSSNSGSGCNNNAPNNLNLSNSVTSNGISRRIVDVSGSPPSLQPILYPISIIGGPDLDRKTMLEAQLRNQIVKIVQAERELQRLTQLLAIEQGLDCQAYISAARASLHHAHHGILSPSESSTTSSSSSTSTEATVASTTPTTQPRHPSLNSPTVPNSTSILLSTYEARIDADSSRASTVPANSITTADDSEDDHHNNVTETTSQGNHQQNERSVGALSDFLSSSNSIALSRQFPCGPTGSNNIGSSHCCRCNLCRSTRSRMMMMRRVLPLSSANNAVAAPTRTAAEVGEGRVEASDFLTRSVTLLASSDLHYQQQERQQGTAQSPPLLPPQPVPDSQSSLYDLPSQHQHNHQLHHHLQQQHHHHQYQHQVLLEDNPPAYEECIRSSSYNWEERKRL